MFLIGVNPLGSLGTSTMPQLVPGLNYTMPKGSGVSFLFLDYYLAIWNRGSVVLPSSVI